MRLLSPSSIFATCPHQLHGLRRSALDPFFSKQSIIQLEPMIREKLEILCGFIETKLKTGEPVEFNLAYMALTTDVITQAVFGKSGCWDCLTRPRFAAEWRATILGAAEYSTLVRHCFSLVELMRKVPYQYVMMLNKRMGFFTQSMNVRSRNRLSVSQSTNNSSQSTQAWPNTYPKRPQD